MSANKPLRIAVNGCGKRATGFWLRRLRKNPLVRIIAICDIVAAPCEQAVAELFGDLPEADRPRVFTDPVRMYAETSPDAAIILTVHGLHYEHCLQALDAGCHISVEKPMATSVNQARDLAQRVNASGKVFQVAFNFPYSERSSSFRAELHAGKHGKLQGISAVIAQPWQSMQIGTWRMRPELSGGGMIYDTGTHLLQGVLYLATSEPVEVSAHVDNCGSPVDINGTANIRFADGTLASVAIIGNGAPHCRISLLLDNGAAEFTSLHGHDLNLSDKEGKPVALPPIDKSKRHDDNFINAILSGEAIRSGADEGLRICELLDAIYSSSQLGKTVPLQLTPATV